MPKYTLLTLNGYQTIEKSFIVCIYIYIFAECLKFVVAEESKEGLLKTRDKIFCNFATILVRDKEVVELNVSEKSGRYIVSKNKKWTDKDRKYVN
jgi:hypothetical protein